MIIKLNNLKNYLSQKRNGTFLLYIYYALIFSSLLSGQSIPFSGDFRFKDYASLSEPLTIDQLISLSLIASGTKPTEMAAIEESIHAAVKGLKQYLDDNSKSESETDTGELVLRYMHENYLKKYYYSQTKLNILINTGNYNCVSSSVFYLILNRSIGLSTYGIQTQDHAFCAVQAEATVDAVDVETTNIWGYNPGTKKEFHDDFSRQTGFAYVPPGKYAERLKMGDRELIGLILQNRIVEHQEKFQYAEALKLAADRLVLTASSQALKDYFDSLQNLAAWYNSRGEYEKGINVFQTSEEGPYNLPDFLIETRYQLVYNFCGSVLRSGDSDTAAEILQQYKELVPESLLQELTFLIEEVRLDSIMKKGYSTSTIEQILSSREKGLITPKRAEEMLVFLYAGEAERISLEKGYLDALVFLTETDSGIRESREFTRLLSVYKQNYAVTVHNEAVVHLRAEEWDKAEAILREGLNVLPGNTLLSDDLKKLEKMQ